MLACDRDQILSIGTQARWLRRMKGLHFTLGGDQSADEVDDTEQHWYQNDLGFYAPRYRNSIPEAESHMQTATSRETNNVQTVRIRRVRYCLYPADLARCTESAAAATTHIRTSGHSNKNGPANTSSQPYYDSTHRDWHQWNDGEEKSYRTYSEQHHKSGDFSSSRERDQQKYWHWRHKHSDSR